MIVSIFFFLNQNLQVNLFIYFSRNGQNTPLYHVKSIQDLIPLKRLSNMYIYIFLKKLIANN